MKRLLAYLFLVQVLTFSLQSWSNADDIRDFQIEGMSIGDSLLNFYSESVIESNKPIYYDNNEFSTFELFPVDDSDTYDGIQVIYLTNDKKYKIYSISGVITCVKSFTICENYWRKILPDLKNSFEKSTYVNDRGEYSAQQDKTGKSKVTQINFEFNSGDRITLEKVKWSKKMNFIDTVKVNIDTNKFVNWLNTKAYN